MKRLAQRVLLIGWDAADWKMITPLLESGGMPNLHRVIQNGVMGNLATLRPVLSPILWTSIATGKTADQHGILGFVEPKPDGSGVQQVSSASRRCKAIWNLLGEHGMRSNVVSWFATHPPERINGCMVSDPFVRLPPVNPETPWPVPPGAVFPSELEECLAPFRLRPHELTPSQLAEFIPRLAEIDLSSDPRPGAVAAMLAQCAGVHAVATWLAEHTEWDFMTVYFNTIDHLAHGFMEYHPPRMSHVSTQDFDLYRHVMTTGYRFHDMLLGRCLQLAGPDTTVLLISDHGFHCDALRPAGPRRVRGEGPIQWHRDYGVLAACGPGIRQDERVYGASLLDICPTILHLLGLPVARDMDGRVLASIFIDRPDIQWVDSYEQDGETREPQEPVTSDDLEAQHAAFQHLRDLGYLDLPDPGSMEAVEMAKRHQLSNLAQVHLSAGRFDQAIPIFESLRNETADEEGATRLRLAQAYRLSGQHEACDRLVEGLLGTEKHEAWACVLRGQVRFAKGDIEEAVTWFRRAAGKEPWMPDVHVAIGAACTRMKQWPDAERAYRTALQTDPDRAEAWHGLGFALFRQDRLDEAIEAMMRSVSLLHRQPLTHLHLGLALLDANRLAWAEQALRTSLEQHPSSPVAHRALARLHDLREEPATAKLHLDLASRIEERTASTASPPRPATTP